MPSLEQRNDTLNKQIDSTDLPAAIQTLIADARKRRRQLRLLALSICLDVLLTVALGWLSVRTHSIATQSESNKQAIVMSCQQTNDARASNEQLWKYLLSLPTPNAPTLQQQAVRKQFSAFIDKTFAPRDCSKADQTQ